MSGHLLVLFGWLTYVLLNAWRDVELQNQGWCVEHLRDQLRIRAMEDPSLLHEPLFQMLDDDLTRTLRAPEGLVASLFLLRVWKTPQWQQHVAGRDALLEKAKASPRLIPLLMIHYKHALHALACTWLNSPLLTTGLFLAAMAQVVWTTARGREATWREVVVRWATRWMPMTPEPTREGIETVETAS